MATYEQAMFRETFERHFTYLGGFLRNTHRYPQRVALTCPERGQSWTYAELGQVSTRLANALQADGIGREDVVVFQLMNEPEFVFLYLAPKLLGAISCPINFRLSAGEIAYILDDSKPTVYVYDADFAATAEQAIALAQHKPRRVLIVDPQGAHPQANGAMSFDAYLAGGSTEPLPELEASIYDETTRLYTSGTTGLPKGVPLNSVAEVLTAHDVIMHFPLSPQDKTMNMSPWFHRGGLYSGGPNPVLYAGAEAVTLRHFSAEATLDAVERYGLTFLIGAPPNLKLLYDAQLARPRNLQSLRGIVTMGAPLEREACIRYQRVLTPNIYNGYGTTEAFWNTFLRPFDLPQKAGSAGRACTDDDVAVVHVYEDRLAEPDDFVAKDNMEVGEVIVRSPAKCCYTYTNAGQRSAQTFYKGWLYIGDLATWDEEEYVTIVGRKDDMIISGGENVHPVQVEEVLNQHPQVAESVVVGVPDPTWGELVVAYIVPKDPSLTARELDEHCKNHPMLARYKRPRLYRFVESVPYTATGKKMHYKVKEQAAEDAKAGLLTEP